MTDTAKIKALAEEMDVTAASIVAGEFIQDDAELAKMDAWLAREEALLRKRYEEKTRLLRSRMAYRHKLLKTWALLNKFLFDGPRMLSYPRASFGFRRSTPKVMMQSGVQMSDVIYRLKMVSWGARYLDFREPTLNKDAIRDDREALTADNLNHMGIKIVQSDEFRIEAPKPQQPAAKPKAVEAASC